MPHSSLTAGRGPGRTASGARLRGPWPLRPKAASGDCADRCTHDSPRRAFLELRDRGRACEIYGAHDSPASLPLRLHEPEGAWPEAALRRRYAPPLLFMPVHPTEPTPKAARVSRRTGGCGDGIDATNQGGLEHPPRTKCLPVLRRNPSPHTIGVAARQNEANLTSQTARRFPSGRRGEGAHPEAGEGLELPFRYRNPPRSAADWLRFAARFLTRRATRSPYA